MKKLCKERLHRLADYLEKSDFAFDMSDYCGGKEVPVSCDCDACRGETVPELLQPWEAQNCGTVFCALGSAARLWPKVAAGAFNWEDFCQELFKFKTDSRLATWCFAADWSRIDNTREGAAKRLRMAADGQIPETFDPKDVKTWKTCTITSIVKH